MKRLMLLAGATVVSACTTTYVPGPDPIPVIGAQIIGLGGSCVDVRDGETADGTPIVVFHCHGSPNERWFIAQGHISESFGSCVDVQGAAAVDGSPIILVVCNGSPSQQWKISDGRVIGIGDKCLDMAGGSAADLTPLNLVACTNAPSQKWSVQ